MKFVMNAQVGHPRIVSHLESTHMQRHVMIVMLVQFLTLNSVYVPCMEGVNDSDKRP